jgi:3-isopropylmalate/(R)-2-methylmalate dehydratase large subunit
MSQHLQTMFEKIWTRHVIFESMSEPTLLYVDLHLLHEVSSAQAFEGLRMSGRTVRSSERCLATVDHAVPTTSDRVVILDQIASRQIQTLRRNCAEFGIQLFDVGDADQGIVHVIGPELGATKPGMTIVCGDSHTSTHGAFGALAFGIGTSEVEHVLALQCLPQTKPKTFRIAIEGDLPSGVTAKDIALTIIGLIGTSGASGYVIEYTGSVIRALSMESRMTLCNMSIEAGGRAAMIAPDEKTFAYLQGRRFSPLADEWMHALEQWKQLPSDAGAMFDRELLLNASELIPCVTWGTSPGMVAPITGCIPEAPDSGDADNLSYRRALDYMALEPGQRMQEITIDRVFIGSCTNARIEDLREAAEVVRGYHVASWVHGMVVPGSQQVKVQAEHEGLDQIFLRAGFEWRESGCSMCLGMNPDSLQPGERCASTSNRNFEGRQGRGGRTHLMSPRMAAAAAVVGHLTDVRKWAYNTAQQNTK